LAQRDEVVHLDVTAPADGTPHETGQQISPNVLSGIRARQIVEREPELGAVPEVLEHDAEFGGVGFDPLVSRMPPALVVFRVRVTRVRRAFPDHFSDVEDVAQNPRTALPVPDDRIERPRRHLGRSAVPPARPRRGDAICAQERGDLPRRVRVSALLADVEAEDTPDDLGFAFVDDLAIAGDAAAVVEHGLGSVAVGQATGARPVAHPPFQGSETWVYTPVRCRSAPNLLGTLTHESPAATVKEKFETLDNSELVDRVQSK